MGRTTTALALVVGATVAPGPAAAAVVLEEGHVDYGARFVGGVLRAQVKDGTASPVVWRDPADVVLHVRSAARASVPAGAAFAFLGTPGSTVWLLPQVQRADLLWPGWNTEEIAAGPLTWTLDAVEGPGRFALFTSAAFGGATKLFDSGDGLPDTTTVAAGTHAHGNWAFSAEGRYLLTFTTGAPLATGTASDTRQLVVTVGAVDPATGAPLPAPDPAPGAPPAQSGTPGGDAPPAANPRGRPTGTARPPASAPRPCLVFTTTARPRLRGRMLTVRVRLGQRSRLRAVLTRGGRVVARGAARATVPRGARTVRLRLTRSLPPHRYRVRLVAAAGGRTVVRHVSARAAPRP